MKTFIIALLVLVILICGILTYCSYLKIIENDLMTIINSVKAEVYRNNWEKSYQYYEELEDKWSKNEGILAMFNDHGELDEIELVLGDLKESISHQDSEHTLKAIAETKTLLERLRKNESLSLENILGLSPNRLSCHIML